METPVISESLRFYNLIYKLWAYIFPDSICEQYADMFVFLTVILCIFVVVALVRFIFSPFLPKRKK